VERSEHRKGTGVERGRARGDKGSGTVPAFENAHGGQKADSGAEAGSTDLEFSGQLALGGKTISGMHLAFGNEGADMLDDLHGQLAVAGNFFFCDLFFHARKSSLLLNGRRVTRR
jgi:hypothetical protein